MQLIETYSLTLIRTSRVFLLQYFLNRGAAQLSFRQWELILIMLGMKQRPATNLAYGKDFRLDLRLFHNPIKT